MTNQLISSILNLATFGASSLYSVGSLEAYVNNILYLVIGFFIMLIALVILKNIIMLAVHGWIKSLLMSNLFSYIVIIGTYALMPKQMLKLVFIIGYGVATGKWPQLTIANNITAAFNNSINWCSKYGIYFITFSALLIIIWVYGENIINFIKTFRYNQEKFRSSKKYANYNTTNTYIPSDYEILGISYNSTREEVIKAYRERAKQVHPDHGGSMQEFIRLTEAYRKIMNSFS